MCIRDSVIVVDKGKIGSGSAGAAGKKWGSIINEPPKGAIALNISATDENRVAHENVGSYSVAVGYEAKAKADESVAIGREANTDFRESVSIGLQSKVKGDQGVSIGSKSAAEKQSVAIGGDTYALGESSIAIGNDDIGGMDHLPEETIKSCLLYTSPSPRDISGSRMPSSA